MKLTSSYISAPTTVRGNLFETSSATEPLSSPPPCDLLALSHDPAEPPRSPRAEHDPPTCRKLPTPQPPEPPRARHAVPGHDAGTSLTDPIAGTVEVASNGTLFFDDFWTEKEEASRFPLESYSTCGIPGPDELPSSLRRDWETCMRVTPHEFFSTLFNTSKVELAESRIGVTRNRNGIRGVDVEMELQCPRSGRNIGCMDRQFTFPQDSPPEVYHRLFDLAPGTQGKGIAKDLLANSFELYDKLGVGEVNLFAALGVGGYAWAKYGFHPKPGRETRKLFSTVAARLDKLEGVPSQTRKLVNKMLAKEDPKAIWAISDLDGITVPRGEEMVSLGKALLLGTSWKGTLNLDDPQARARFDQYTQR